MKKIILIYIIIMPLLSCGGNESKKDNDNGGQFKLSSQSVKDKEMMKKDYTYCGGENKSPQLSWFGAPQKTESYAITIHDGDAPTESGWWHWVVYDIPKDTNSLEEAQKKLPIGSKIGKNDAGEMKYMGPCPPLNHGIHRYKITIYALDVKKLNMNPETSSPAAISFKIWSHTLSKKTITPIYKREGE